MSRAAVAGALALGLVLLGLLTLSGALVALALPPALYVAAALLAAPGAPQLRAERALASGRAAPGAAVAVELTVTNDGPAPATLLVEDVCPAGLAIADGRPSLVARLAPGEAATLAYQVAAPRGAYRFAAARVTLLDPLGLRPRAQMVAAPGQLLILPAAARFPRLRLRPRRTRVYSGTIPARQGGPGVEFFGVRDYQAGDPVRWINARAGARHPERLFVNEFEQERVADIGIILDARRTSDLVAGGQALFEYGVQAAAALAETLIAQGNRVGVLVYGNAVDWTLPGYGKLQRERVLRALARAETGDRAALASLDDIPTRLFPARSQLVLISPLQPEDAPALLRLRGRGYELLLVSPDPVAYEAAALGDGGAVRAAVRLARLERALLLRRLRRAGLPVVDWRVEAPLAQALAAAGLAREG